MTGRLLWVSIMPPPHDGTVGRLVLTREGEGEEPKAACLRAGLLAFPDIPVFTLSIAMWPIPEHVMFPDDMLDTPLDGLKVADAQRLLAEQVIPDQKPN